MTLNTGAARADIANVIATYNNCADRGQIDELLGIFTEDAIYDLPVRGMNGRQEIRDFLTGIVERGREANSEPRSGGSASKLAGSRHHLTTSRIEFAGDEEADAWTYFYVMRSGTIFQEGLYIDHLRLEADEWKISRRRVKEIWTDYERVG